MLFVSPEVAKLMDPTMTGCPLYIDHVDNNKIDFTEAHGNADGWVIKSFYEPLDGSHWAEFLAITDEAKEKIKDGWTLSNSYNITDHGEGGQWHNVDYEIEVKNGKYGHLSLVDNARYEESIILTPDEFKAYQQKLRGELEAVKNSKGDKKMSFFKKEKVTKLDNEKDIAGLSVILEKSKREVTITQLMNEVDASEMAKKDTSAKYAADTDLVKVGDEEISVADLVAKITEFMASLEEGGSEEEADADSEVEEVANESDDEEADDKKKDKKDDKKDNSKSGLSLLKAAKKPIPAVVENTAPKRMSLREQIKMGSERY